MREDVSLELAEAAELLALLHYVVEVADAEHDWLQLRAPFGAALHAVERLVSAAVKGKEGD